MQISEIFMSIQGESTFAGLPCVFIRLAGCNLACRWCDTTYARLDEGSMEMSPEEVMAEAGRFRCRLVEITGGEPLLQDETPALARLFVRAGWKVLVETNGSVDLGGLDPAVIKIVDIKCPSSGHAGSFRMENLAHITPEDEIKFVIADREDYEFAKRCLDEFVSGRTEKILFAPVRTELDPALLADWILRDGLPVRLQLQLHTYIWNGERAR